MYMFLLLGWENESSISSMEIHNVRVTLTPTLPTENKEASV